MASATHLFVLHQDDPSVSFKVSLKLGLSPIRVLGLERPLEMLLKQCWHFTEEVLGTGESEGPA